MGHSGSGLPTSGGVQGPGGVAIAQITALKLSDSHHPDQTRTERGSPEKRGAKIACEAGTAGFQPLHPAVSWSRASPHYQPWETGASATSSGHSAPLRSRAASAGPVDFSPSSWLRAQNCSRPAAPSVHCGFPFAGVPLSQADLSPRGPFPPFSLHPNR